MKENKFELTNLDATLYKYTLDNGLDVYLLPYENKTNYYIHYVTNKLLFCHSLCFDSCDFVLNFFHFFFVKWIEFHSDYVTDVTKDNHTIH